MRRRCLIMLGAVALAACGPDASPPITPAATASLSPPSTTMIPDSTTTIVTTPTTAPTPEDVPLVYFRFDESGLYLVDDTGERQLDPDAVTAASHDGMGGAVFSIDPEGWRPGVQWWKAGTGDVEMLPYDSGWVATLDDGPVLVTSGGTCPDRDDGTVAWFTDLRTAEERAFGCFGGEDAGPSLVSGGGELLVGVNWIAFGSNSTARTIDFYDTAGVRIDHPYNPVPESCEPCDLDAHLSPDGALLAYRLRPDAKWSIDADEQHRLDVMTPDEWWDTSRDIDADVSVIDLASGDTIFTTALPAGERLTDFDGRFLVLEGCTMAQVNEHEQERTCSSRVIDSAGEVPGFTVQGGVRLVSPSCCAPPTADVFPPMLKVLSPADGSVVNERQVLFEGIADPAAELTAAGRYPVEIAPDGVWSVVLVLNAGGNVAAFAATDSAGNETVRRVVVTFEIGAVLRAGGIGGIDFGTPIDNALADLVEVLGQPSRVDDGERYGCYAFVEQLRAATWDAVGLRAVFTDQDARLHLASWQLVGPGVTTDGGIGWGSTAGELHSAHPEVVFGINEWAPEFFIETSAGTMRGGLDWPDFVADLQVALNEHGAGLEVTGEWDGPTTDAVLGFIEAQGLHGPGTVLSALGLPSADVGVTWITAGQESSCA